MLEMVKIEGPTSFICHFKDQENMPAFPYYQCYFDPQDTNTVSPSGDFVRFACDHPDPERRSEIHGWRKIEDIVIDEILTELEQEAVEAA